VSCGSFESRTVAHAEAAVAAELRPPGDLRAFVGPEQAIRSLPTDRRKVVCEKTCSLWCYSFTGQAVEPEYLSLIQSDDGQTGTFRVTRFGEAGETSIS
jgi:hypothetical protein